MSRAMLHTFVAVILISTPLCPLSLDDFDSLFSDPNAFQGFEDTKWDLGAFGGGDMGFGDGDFGNDLFGDFGFNDLFGPPADEPKDERPASGTVKVENPQALFTTALDAKVKKVPDENKQVVHDFLNQLSRELEEMSEHMTSFGIGITYKERMAPHLPLIGTTTEHLALILSRSPYIKTLYKKDFNDLRSTLLSTIATAQRLNEDLGFIDAYTDSLDAPSLRERREQDATLDSVEHFLLNTIKPLIKDLEKVIEHPDTKKGLEEKVGEEKKATEAAAQRTKSGGGYSGGGGGWTDDYAGGFAGDGWSSPGMGMGGWNDGGDFWGGAGGSDFGGGGWGDFDSWGGGSYDSWGGGGGYDSWGSGGGSSWGSSSGGNAGGGYSGGGGESGSEVRMAAAPQKEASTRGSNETMPLYTGGGEESEEARLDKQIVTTADQLRAWSAQYAAASDKDDALEKIMGERAFGKAVRIIGHAGSMAITSGDMSGEALTALRSGLKGAMPLVVAVSKYVPSQLETVKERVAHGKQKGDSPDKVKRMQREAAQKTLLAFMQAMHEEDALGVSDDFLEALKAYESDRMTALEKLFEKTKKHTTLAQRDLDALARLSQNILMQPISASYAPDDQEVDDDPETKGKERTLQERLIPLRNVMVKFIEKNMTVPTQSAVVMKRAHEMAAEGEAPNDTLIKKVVTEQFADHPQKAVILQRCTPFSRGRAASILLESRIYERLNDVWKQEQQRAQEAAAAAEASFAQAAAALNGDGGADEAPQESAAATTPAGMPAEVTPEMLAQMEAQMKQMPPEMRAQMEAMMAQQGGAPAATGGAGGADGSD